MIELGAVVQEMFYWLEYLSFRIRVLTGWTFLLTLAVAGLYVRLAWRAWRG